jgi:hypothetical protein
MPMQPCTKCLENSWSFEKPDSETVRATCRHCAYEVEFSPRKGKKKAHRQFGSKKVKVLEAGEPCRACGTNVERREHAKPPKYKAGSYYFSWWLACPSCKALYMIESAKVMFDAGPMLAFEPAAPVASFDPAQIGDGKAPW